MSTRSFAPLSFALALAAVSGCDDGADLDDTEGHQAPAEAGEPGPVVADGDLVLATAAWDGAFLCGSVARAWLGVADVDAFRSAFESKGPMRNRLGRVPTFLINEPEPALVGLTHAEVAAA